MSDQGRGRARGRGRGRGAPAGAAPGAPAPGVGIPAAPGGAWGGGEPAGLQAAPAPQQGAWGGAGGAPAAVPQNAWGGAGRAPASVPQQGAWGGAGGAPAAVPQDASGGAGGAPAAAPRQGAWDGAGGAPAPAPQQGVWGGAVGAPAAAAGIRSGGIAGGRGHRGRGHRGGGHRGGGTATLGGRAPPGIPRPAAPANGTGGNTVDIPRTTDRHGGATTDVVSRGMEGGHLSLQDRIERKGKHGQEIKLITNYVNLAMSNQWQMKQYSVTFNPEVDNVRVRRGMIHGLNVPFNQYDGGAIMYTLEELQPGLLLTVNKRNSDEVIHITFTKTGTVSWSDPCAMSIYNITFKKIFRSYMKLLEEPRKRAYIDENRTTTVERYNLEVQKGFMATVCACENGLLLNTDLFSKIVRTQNVLGRMSEIGNNTRNFKANVEKELLGSIVLTRYNNKTYRVDDIAWNENPDCSFTRKDGSQETFAEYMFRQHEKVTHDRRQPLLVSRSKRYQHGEEAQLIKLVPEHCFLTGLSDSMRTDFNLMKSVAVHTRVGPEPRVDSLTKFVQSIHASKEAVDELAQWGITMDTKLFELTGRVLPAEKITVGRGQTAQSRNADWGTGVRRNLLVPVSISTWLAVFPRRCGQVANNVIHTLMGVMQPMDIRMSGPITCELPNDNTQTYLQAIDSQLNQEPQLVVCILPTNRKDRYDALKKRLTVQLGIPSQIIVERTVSKSEPMLRSVCTKIGLQINVKLGGELWAVDIPLKTAMVVGYDTYHDSGDTVKGASQGALVCSLTPNFTRYWGSTVKHHGHQELCSHLYTQMKGGLAAYNKHNKSLPGSIFYYRDGVGDGQLQHIMEFELPQIKKAIKDKGTDYNPKLVFVVVKKRINTKFFTQDLENPAPGTVVDNDVCRAVENAGYDFFLVSQSVRQGTATPTHYHVLVDEGGFGADKTQRMTYKLCHLYYNWPGTIRTPAPCQYAHKLAYLAGQSLHASPKSELNDKLHYL